MQTPADLVLFGIQAAVRVNAQYRRAYADSTRARPLALPLPNFPATPDLSTALTFYRTTAGQEYVAQNARIRELLTRLQQAGKLDPPDEDTLVALCQTHQAIELAQAGLLADDPHNPIGISGRDLVPLLTIRQWSYDADPHPSMLRRMAGTLINLAVDYVAQMPELASPTNSRGKALRGLLEAVDSIDFAEDARPEIIEQLAVATLESLRDHPDLVAGDETARLLVRNLAKGLYDDVKRLGAAGDLSQQDRIRNWGELVLRSVLSSAGETVLAEPGKFLGVRGAAAQDLVTQVGTSILASVVDDGDGLFAGLLTPRALDRIVKAALTTVGDHPELVGADGEGLKRLIASVAHGLAQSSAALGSDLLVEGVRLILEKTAAHLELLLPGGPNQPEKHLLVLVGKEVLGQLAAPPPEGATWKPRFDAADGLRLLELVAGEIVQNPEWVTKASGQQTHLGALIGAVLDVLRRSAPPRLRPETAVAILEAALRATARRMEFLENRGGSRLIALAITTIMTSIFTPEPHAKATWLLARDDVLSQLVAIALDRLALYGVTVEQIQRVGTGLGEAVALLDQGGHWSPDHFTERLDEALSRGMA